jgi:hypothetical protein
MRLAEAASTVRLRYNSSYTFSNSARNLLKEICPTSEFDAGPVTATTEKWVSVGSVGPVTRPTEDDAFALLTDLIGRDGGLAGSFVGFFAVDACGVGLLDEGVLDEAGAPPECVLEVVILLCPNVSSTPMIEQDIGRLKQ